jgi:hypothetical protein
MPESRAIPAGGSLGFATGGLIRSIKTIAQGVHVRLIVSIHLFISLIKHINNVSSGFPGCATDVRGKLAIEDRIGEIPIRFSGKKSKEFYHTARGK